MKIGLIIYGSLDTLSGGYLYDRKLVASLRERGDTVDVISLPWRNYAAHFMDNFRFRLPSNCDVLIQDELNHPSLIAANAQKHPCPIIALVHHLRSSESRPSWQNWLYRLVERQYLESVDAFIFNSLTTKRVVNSILENGKTSLVAYPPTDRFEEPISESEIKARAERSPLRVLFLGNVIRRKGLHTLLEAIHRQRPGIQIDVVGSLNSEPGYARHIQRFAAVNGLLPMVHFHGALDHQPLVNMLRQAHVLVVPSSYEGYGIAYLEGMCFGLPAIGTSAGAAGEIITDGVDGFLTEPEDADLLAGWLEHLAEKREDLIRMSLAARERYLRQPKWEQTAVQIREFLLSFCG